MADLDQSQPSLIAEASSAQWGYPLRIFGMALVLLILGVFAVLFAPVVTIILLGFVFAFVFHATARFFERFGAKYTFTTIVIYLLITLAGVTLILSVGRVVLRNADQLAQSVESAADVIRSGELPEGLSTDSAELLNDIGVPEMITVGSSVVSQFLARMSLGLSSLAGLIGTLGVALLFAFMLQLGLHASNRNVLAFVPGANRRDVTLLLDKLDQTWGGYLIAGIIFAAVLALLSFVQFTLMNVPFALVLAIATGILTLIPSIGGLLATVLVFAVCVVLGPTNPNGMDNLIFALLVAVVNGVITQGTYYFVGLPLTGRGVRLPIAVVLIGSVAGLATGSLLFAWLTVPIIASLRILLGYLIAKANGLDPFPNESVPTEEGGFLRQLLAPPLPDAAVLPDGEKR
ncbi:MAG TPA: AI-2E family transporter [Candidatus Limnocylindrales bacterium]|nr:AI-2E family transporter [Candidatus Limnocylindrales bacterium]